MEDHKIEKEGEEDQEVKLESKKAVRKRVLEMQKSQIIGKERAKDNSLHSDYDEEKNYFSDFSDEDSPSKAHRHCYFNSNIHACKNKG